MTTHTVHGCHAVLRFMYVLGQTIVNLVIQVKFSNCCSPHSIYPGFFFITMPPHIVYSAL